MKISSIVCCIVVALFLALNNYHGINALDYVKSPSELLFFYYYACLNEDFDGSNEFYEFDYSPTGWIDDKESFFDFLTYFNSLNDALDFIRDFYNQIQAYRDDSETDIENCLDYNLRDTNDFKKWFHIMNNNDLFENYKEYLLYIRSHYHISIIAAGKNYYDDEEPAESILDYRYDQDIAIATFLYQYDWTLRNYDEWNECVRSDYERILYDCFHMNIFDKNRDIDKYDTANNYKFEDFPSFDRMVRCVYSRLSPTCNEDFLYAIMLETILLAPDLVPHPKNDFDKYIDEIIKTDRFEPVERYTSFIAGDPHVYSDLNGGEAVRCGFNDGSGNLIYSSDFIEIIGYVRNVSSGATYLSGIEITLNIDGSSYVYDTRQTLEEFKDGESVYYFGTTNDVKVAVIPIDGNDFEYPEDNNGYSYSEYENVYGVFYNQTGMQVHFYIYKYSNDGEDLDDYDNSVFPLTPEPPFPAQYSLVIRHPKEFESQSQGGVLFNGCNVANPDRKKRVSSNYGGLNFNCEYAVKYAHSLAYDLIDNDLEDVLYKMCIDDVNSLNDEPYLAQEHASNFVYFLAFAIQKAVESDFMTINDFHTGSIDSALMITPSPAKLLFINFYACFYPDLYFYENTVKFDPYYYLNWFSRNDNYNLIESLRHIKSFDDALNYIRNFYFQIENYFDEVPETMTCLNNNLRNKNHFKKWLYLMENDDLFDLYSDWLLQIRSNYHISLSAAAEQYCDDDECISDITNHNEEYALEYFLYQYDWTLRNYDEWNECVRADYEGILEDCYHMHYDVSVDDSVYNEDDFSPFYSFDRMCRCVYWRLSDSCNDDFVHAIILETILLAPDLVPDGDYEEYIDEIKETDMFEPIERVSSFVSGDPHVYAAGSAEARPCNFVGGSGGVVIYDSPTIQIIGYGEQKANDPAFGTYLRRIKITFLIDSRTYTYDTNNENPDSFVNDPNIIRDDVDEEYIKLAVIPIKVDHHFHYDTGFEARNIFYNVQDEPIVNFIIYKYFEHYNGIGGDIGYEYDPYYSLVIRYPQKFRDQSNDLQAVLFNTTNCPDSTRKKRISSDNDGVDYLNGECERYVKLGYALIEDFDYKLEDIIYDICIYDYNSLKIYTDIDYDKAKYFTASLIYALAAAANSDFMTIEHFNSGFETLMITKLNLLIAFLFALFINKIFNY